MDKCNENVEQDQFEILDDDNDFSFIKIEYYEGSKSSDNEEHDDIEIEFDDSDIDLTSSIFNSFIELIEEHIMGMEFASEDDGSLLVGLLWRLNL